MHTRLQFKVIHWSTLPSCFNSFGEHKALAKLTNIVCLTRDSFSSLSLLARFATTIFETFHVRQAEMFLIQIKNIFACRQANVACSVLACQFRHANLQAKVTELQILMLDKQCWPVSPGLSSKTNQPNSIL